MLPVAWKRRNRLWRIAWITTQLERVAQRALLMQICVADGTPGRIGGTGEEGSRYACPVRAPVPASASKPMPAPEGPARQPPAAPPESRNSQRPWPGLDRLGLLQAIGGLLLGLIALFSSSDHITIAGTSVQLQQQWGPLFIAASVATVLVEFVSYSAPLGRDAPLATRARDRAADEADRDRDRTARSRKRQVGRLERLHIAAVLSARVQLDPSATNRARLRAFLALISGEIPPDAAGDGP